MSPLGQNSLVFIQPRFAKHTALERMRKLANHFYTEKSNRIRTNTVGALYLLIMATTMPPTTMIVHCNTSVKKTAVRPPTKKCLSYLQAWEVTNNLRGGTRSAPGST